MGPKAQRPWEGMEDSHSLPFCLEIPLSSVQRGCVPGLSTERRAGRCPFLRLSPGAPQTCGPGSTLLVFLAPSHSAACPHGSPLWSFAGVLWNLGERILRRGRPCVFKCSSLQEIGTSPPGAPGDKGQMRNVPRPPGAHRLRKELDGQADGPRVGWDKQPLFVDLFIHSSSAPCQLFPGQKPWALTSKESTSNSGNVRENVR